MRTGFRILECVTDIIELEDTVDHRFHFSELYCPKHFFEHPFRPHEDSLQPDRPHEDRYVIECTVGIEGADHRDVAGDTNGVNRSCKCSCSADFDDVISAAFVR